MLAELNIQSNFNGCAILAKAGAAFYSETLRLLVTSLISQNNQGILRGHQ